MPETPWDYEAAVAAVEATLARLETGELPLAAVLEEFEQASRELQQCETFLQQKQSQLELLIETLED